VAAATAVAMAEVAAVTMGAEGTVAAGVPSASGMVAAQLTGAVAVHTEVRWELMVALRDSPRGLPSGTPLSNSLRRFLNPRLWPQGLAYIFIYLCAGSCLASLGSDRSVRPDALSLMLLWRCCGP
jgi:hypothetical protein